MKSAPYPSDATGRMVGFLFLALIPLATLVPAAFPAWLVQDLVLRWISALVFLLCLGSCLLKSKLKTSLDLDFANIVLLLLLGWVLLSVKNSRDAFDSFYAFRSFLALVLWWFSLRMVWERWPGLYPAFEKVFLWTSVAASAWLILTTAGHGLNIPFFVEKTIPRIGPFPNENIAAGFLGLALVWGLLKKLHQVPVPSWALAVLLVGWCLTKSRGGFMSLLFVSVFYCLLHMKEIEGRLARWRKGQWLAAGGAVILLAALLAPMVDRVFNALATDPNANKRLDLWWSGLRMALAQPVFGFGPGTFEDVFPFYKPASLWNITTPFAHNEYLQTAVDSGLPALALTLLFLWVLLRGMGKGLAGVAPFKGLALETQAMEAGFFLVLLEAAHNCVDFTFHEWSHRLVLLGFATYAFRHKRVEDDVRTTWDFSKRLYLGGTAFLVCLILWLLGVGGLRDFLARTYDFHGIVLQEAGDLDRAEADERKSLAYRGDFMMPWNSLGAIEKRRAETAAKPSERKKHYRLAEADFEQAMQVSPYALAPQANLVQLWISEGKLDEALDLQSRIVEKIPTDPTQQDIQAQILLALGRPDDAVTAAQKAVDLDGMFVPSYLCKARAMEALGKKKDAIRVYRQIEEIVQKAGLPDAEQRIRMLEAKIQKLSQ